MRIKVVILLILFFGGSVAPCPALTTREVVEKIQEQYEKIWSLTADFAQESTGKMLNQTRITKARGKVYFQKSGLMRWEYTTPPKSEWVSDGRTLWIYQPEENQVVVRGMERGEGKLFFAFLVGEGDLRRDFEIHRWDREIEESKQGYRIELVPREPHAMMDRLILTIDRETGYVAQAEIYDVYGNLTRTLFKRIRVNRELPRELFTFDVPPGTEVIENFPGSSQ